MAKLGEISWDLIEKSFARVCVDTPVQDGRLVLVTEEHYPKALRFLDEQYTEHEPMSQSLDIHWDDVQKQFFLGALKCNISVMIVNNDTDEVMAIRVTRIARHDDPADFTKMQKGAFRTSYQFCAYCDSKANFFGHFNTQETFHFVALAVHEKYTRRGLGGTIFKAAIDLIKYLNLPVAYIKGEASSNYSQKIYEKYGFEFLFRQYFSDYKEDGQVVIPDYGEHNRMTLFGLKITACDSS